MPRFRMITAICLAAFAAGCASKSSSGSAAAPAPAAQASPASSPLAQVEIGMTAQEVSNILGAPTNQVSYNTGKSWIPYYFGDDARRTEWSYKGLGRIIFTGGNIYGAARGRVGRVDYDPNETGIRVN